MQQFHVIHGPNLNLLGRRETLIYGSVTLDEINQQIQEYARRNRIRIKIVQSNSEGQIIDAIQAAAEADGLVINPAGYTHTSIAIRDALTAVAIPAVEVHLTNIAGREEFRRYSLTAAACLGQISGLGGQGYLLALDFLRRHVQERKEK